MASTETIVVQVPGHGPVQFPSSMSNEQIEAAIKKNYFQEEQPFTKVTPGGPMGAVIGEGVRQFGNLVDKAAYGAGGAITDTAAKVLPPEGAAAAGYLGNLGVQAGATMAGGEASKLAAPVFRPGARALMQSAVKPTVADIRSGDAAKAIETLLKEGVNPNKAGVEKLRGKIADLNTEIKQAIVNSDATIDKMKAASTLNDAMKRFEKQVNPNSDIAAIEKAWSEFLSHPLLQGKKDIPVQLAQEMKQGTYRSLGDKPYGELQGASVEAQKQLARGLKEGISDAVPGVAKMNARESELINALDVAERRALLDLNKNPGGLAWLANNPTMLAAFMADKSALFKSVISRMLYSGEVVATPARVGIGYQQATSNSQR